MSFRKRFSEVVIIGSGPSALGKGWGTVIDDTSTVIRFTEQLDYNEDDYGKEFTYGFYQVSPKFIRQLEREPPSREPDLGWVSSHLKGGEYEYGTTIDRVCQKAWVVGAKEFLPHEYRSRKLRLTRGCVAACWAIEACHRWGTIILVGFDFVRQGYCEGGKFGAKPSSTWRSHNFFIERPLLEKLANRNQVSICFAQDIWK